MGQLTRPRRHLVLAAILIAGVALPIAWSGIAALGRQWHPTGDWAVMELQTRDVGSGATPLVGPYSRYGWNHPGPLLFWLLALPYRLSGSSSGSLLFSAAVINVAAVVGIGVFAWRRGRLALVAITSTALGLVVLHIGPSQLRDPWNPSVTVLPLALFIVTAWSTAEGDRIAPLVLAVVGSFLVQSHIGFVPMVVVLTLIGVLGFVRAGGSRTPVVVGGIALALCWIPVLVDQFWGSGNLMSVTRYFTTGGHPGTGLGSAVGIIARELGGIAPWLGGREPVDPVDGHLLGTAVIRLVVPTVAYWLAILAAHRSNARSAVRFQAITGVCALVAVVSVSRITPPVFDYLVRWVWIVAMLVWVSIVWSFWSAFVTIAAARRRVLAVATTVLVAACAVSVTWSSARTIRWIDRVGTPDGEWWVQVDAITPDTLQHLADTTPSGSLVLVTTLGTVNGSIADGVRLQIERAGFDVAVDDELVNTYGESRAISGRTPAATLVVVTGPSADESTHDPRLTRIAHWDPMTPDERAIQAADMAVLADQLRAVGRDDLAAHLWTSQSLDEARGLDGVDQELLDTVERGRRRGDQVAVFILDDRS